MRTSTKTLGGIVLAAAVITGGTAYTASNTLAPSTVKGYGSQQISGVNAEQVTYNTTNSGEFIDSVRLVLTGDTRAKEIRIAFNDAHPQVCSDSGLVETHSEQAGTDQFGEPVFHEVVDRTVYTCNVGELPVAAAGKFALVAVDPGDADYANGSI